MIENSSGKMVSRYTHIYLYAKGVYKCSDVIEDMRKIIANYSKKSLDDISENDIINTLIDVAYAYMTKFNFEHFVKRFLVPDYETTMTKYRTVNHRIVAGLLNIISFSKGESETCIGNPDYTLLEREDFNFEEFGGSLIGLDKDNTPI